MKIQIESTDKIVIVNNAEMRIWKGASEAGVPLFAFIALIAVPEDQPAEVFDAFNAELRELENPGMLSTVDGRVAF